MTTTPNKHDFDQTRELDNVDIFLYSVLILFFFLVFFGLLATPWIEQYRFGAPQLVEERSVNVRVVQVRISTKSACVQFIEVVSGRSHSCYKVNAALARDYQVGEVYWETCQLWRNKQYEYCKFPNLG